jgi:hypothetical protein
LRVDSRWRRLGPPDIPCPYHRLSIEVSESAIATDLHHARPSYRFELCTSLWPRSAIAAGRQIEAALTSSRAPSALASLPHTRAWHARCIGGADGGHAVARRMRGRRRADAPSARRQRRWAHRLQRVLRLCVTVVQVLHHRSPPRL